jgi:hypothetical protein
MSNFYYSNVRFYVVRPIHHTLFHSHGKKNHQKLRIYALMLLIIYNKNFRFLEDIFVEL